MPLYARNNHLLVAVGQVIHLYRTTVNEIIRKILNYILQLTADNYFSTILKDVNFCLAHSRCSYPVKLSNYKYYILIGLDVLSGLIKNLLKYPIS